MKEDFGRQTEKTRLYDLEDLGGVEVIQARKRTENQKASDRHTLAFTHSAFCSHPVLDLPALPALGGRCVTPGDMLFLCREGWASGKRLGFPRELTGLLYTKLLWLDTGMETGISKLGGGTAWSNTKFTKQKQGVKEGNSKWSSHVQKSLAF